MEAIQQALESAWGMISGFIFTALLARLLWHVRQVKMRQRKLFSVDILWEIPVAILAIIFGAGIADYFGIDGMAAQAIVGAMAWLGPRGVEDIVCRIIERKTGA